MLGFIAKNGICLREQGINNFAFNKGNSIVLINFLKKHKIQIVGGDVLVMNNGKLKHNYNNWCCEKNELELIDEFITRSCDYALNYINAYINEEAFFVLVTENLNNPNL